MLAFNSQLSFARHILLTQKINPSENHEFHNRESTQWSGKSQIPQLPIHPMDWKSPNSTTNCECGLTQWSKHEEWSQAPPLWKIITNFFPHGFKK